MLCLLSVSSVLFFLSQLQTQHRATLADLGRRYYRVFPLYMDFTGLLFHSTMNKIHVLFNEDSISRLNTVTEIDQAVCKPQQDEIWKRAYITKKLSLGARHCISFPHLLSLFAGGRPGRGFKEFVEGIMGCEEPRIKRTSTRSSCVGYAVSRLHNRNPNKRFGAVSCGDRSIEVQIAVNEWHSTHLEGKQ